MPRGRNSLHHVFAALRAGLSFGPLLALPFAAPAFAVDNTQILSAGQTKSSSTLSEEYRCGMDCRYHQANDAMILDATYLMNKLDSVKNSDDPDAVAAAAGGVCDSGMDIDDCKSRYTDYVTIALVRLRQAIGNNSNTVALLTSGRKNDGTTGESASIASVDGKKDSYSPTMLKLSDLEKQYRANPAAAKQLNPKERQDAFRMETHITNPKDFFTAFRKQEVVGNPKTPENGYKLSMVDRDANGVAKTDEEALKLYEAAKKGLDEGPKPDDSAAKTAARGKSPLEMDDISKQAYVDARNSLVGKANAKYAEFGSKKGEKKPDPKPSGKPSPAPSDGIKTAEITVDSSPARAPAGKGLTELEIEKPKETDSNLYIRYQMDSMLKRISQLFR